MNIIAANRGTGKTTWLIQKSAELDIPILCPTGAKAQSIEYKAQRLNIKIPKPIAYNSIQSTRGLKKKEVLIDDIDIFLEYMIGIKVEYATITDDYNKIFKLDNVKEKSNV